jgi:hypothetical protein
MEPGSSIDVHAVAVDSWNNRTTSALITITLDGTVPTLAPSVSPNPVIVNGAVTVEPNASDDVGIAAATCDPADTSSVGAKSVNCTATDVAGNVGSAAAEFDVTYGISLLYDTDKANKSGSTVKLSLALVDANAENVTGTATSATALRIEDANGTTIRELNQDLTRSPGKKARDYTIKIDTTGLTAGEYHLVFVAAGDPIEHVAPFVVK